MFSHERKKNGEDAGTRDPGAFGICLRSERPEFMVIVQNGRANEFLETSKEEGKGPH